MGTIQVITDKENIDAIADAVRLKTGSSEVMTLSEIPTNIAAIETGGNFLIVNFTAGEATQSNNVYVYNNCTVDYTLSDILSYLEESCAIYAKFNSYIIPLVYADEYIAIFSVQIEDQFGEGTLSSYPKLALSINASISSENVGTVQLYNNGDSAYIKADNAQTAANTASTTAEEALNTANAAVPKVGATMEGALVAQSNANYTTAQMRNIIYISSDEEIPATSPGDVVIVYEA